MTSTLLFSPKGRIGRRDFWIGFAFVMLGSMLAGALPVVGPILGPLVMLWPRIVIYVKRLHDFGSSGWLLLLPFSVGMACMALVLKNGGGALVAAAPNDFAKLMSTPEIRKSLLYLEVALAVEVAFLGWVGFTRGDAEANKFGPAPASST